MKYQVIIGERGSDRRDVEPTPMPALTAIELAYALALSGVVTFVVRKQTGKSETQLLRVDPGKESTPPNDKDLFVMFPYETVRPTPLNAGKWEEQERLAFSLAGKPWQRDMISATASPKHMGGSWS